MKDGMPVRCTHCSRRALDTGEGYLVDENGLVHRCPGRRAKTPEEIEERCRFTIQRPAPIQTPPPSDGRMKYPWEHMLPGDHFLVPTDDDAMTTRVGQSGRDWCKTNRPDVTIRAMRVPKGVRVFMVEAERAEVASAGRSA